ncbi:ABC transporter permease [Microbacterium soli]|uniref:Transport permease protein n=1 Tax=Microbacterium soli TaxID=446075 RepID=A0ABP7MS67_9MICO
MAGTFVDVSQYDRPGHGNGLVDVVRWRYLLGVLIRKGTATRYRNSALGWVWSYVKPAAQFVIYYFVMGIILQNQRVEQYAIYLFSGIVIVNLFNEAFGNATNSIVDNRALVRKIYLPRELFPVAAIVGSVIHFLPQLAILIAVCLVLGWVPTVGGLAGFMAGILLVLVFALGLGLFFSGLNVRYRDAQNFVDLIKMFSTWTSPVLYTWVMMANALHNHSWATFVYMSNPLTVGVELSHTAIWAPLVATPLGVPDYFGWSMLTAAIAALASLVIGQLVFRHYERTFAQDL